MALPCLEALLLYFVLLGVLSYLSLSFHSLGAQGNHTDQYFPF